MKMTFQPKKRSRAKVHGFRARMSTKGGRKSFSCKKIKRKKKNYQHKTKGRIKFMWSFLLSKAIQ